MDFLEVNWSLIVSITSGVFSLFLAAGMYFVTQTVRTSALETKIEFGKVKEELKTAFQSEIKASNEEMKRELKEVENKVVLKDSEDYYKKYIEEKMKSFERHIK